MANLGNQFQGNEDVKSNSLLARLLQSVKGLLIILQQRNVAKDNEKKSFQLLMNTKQELLKRKMEHF